MTNRLPYTIGLMPGAPDNTVLSQIIARLRDLENGPGTSYDDTALASAIATLVRFAGEVDDGDVSGSVVLDARDGGHTLNLTDDTQVTFSNAPGARVVYINVTSTAATGSPYEFTVENTACSTGLSTFLYTNGAWAKIQAPANDSGGGDSGGGSGGGSSAHDTIMADSPEYYLPLKDAPGTTGPIQNLGTGTVVWSNTAAVFDGEKADISSTGVTHIVAANTVAGRQILGDRASITLEMTIITPDLYTGGVFFRYPDSFTWTYGTGGSNYNVHAEGAATGSVAVSATGSPNAVPSAFVGVHHVAYTYDGTTQRLYFDGAEVANAARTGVIINNGYDQVIIGGRDPYFQTNLGNFAVAHFAMFPSALTPERVAAHATACIAELS